MTGKYVYWSLLFTIATALIWGGLMDLVLLRMDSKYTISDYLRVHPQWFWWPTALAIAGLVWLALHLYGWPLDFTAPPPPTSSLEKQHGKATY